MYLITYLFYYTINMTQYFVHNFFFCKQKTAYDMRISDWSSDVCSSDLSARGVKSIQFRLDRRLGAKAAFVRNDRLLMLNPVEGVICEGSGIQMTLAQKLRRAGVDRKSVE